MEPAIDAFTTSWSPARSAASAMMSSAALPNVALSSPPTPSPMRSASCSVGAAHPPGEGQDGKRGGDENQQISFGRQNFQADRNRKKQQKPVHHGGSAPMFDGFRSFQSTQSTA